MRTPAVYLVVATLACAACNNDPTPPALDGLVQDDSAVTLSRHHRRHCFTRIDLGTLGGATSDVAAINRRGEITGDADTASGDNHAYLWRRGVMTDLGTLGGPRSLARALDDRGTVVGQSQTESGRWHAFVWRRGVMTDLSPDVFQSTASDINDRGQIVGATNPGNLTQSHAVLWQDGAMIDLGAGRESGATAINRRGDVIGGSFDGDFLARAGTITLFPDASLEALDDRGRVVGYSALGRAFVWQDGVTTELGTLGGAHSAALASNGNEIVGWAETATGETHAVVWRHGRIHDLHALGAADAVATGINVRGDIVGTAEGLTHAFFWADGDATDLGETLGEVVLDDADEIAGTVRVASGDYHAVVWQPRRCTDERAPAVD